MNTWTADRDCTAAGLAVWALEAAEHLVDAEDDAELGRWDPIELYLDTAGRVRDESPRLMREALERIAS